MIKDSFKDLSQFNTNIATSRRKTAEESNTKLKFIRKKDQENKSKDQNFPGQFDTK